MYNRYIPQPDGTYRRRPADVPQPPAAAPTGTAQTGAASPESRFFSAAAAAGEAALPEESALFQSAQAGASRSPAARRNHPNHPKIPFWASVPFCISFFQRTSAWKT